MLRWFLCFGILLQNAWAAEIHIEVDNRRLQEGERGVVPECCGWSPKARPGCPL